MMLLRWEKLWSKHRDSVSIDLVHEACGNSAVPEPRCRQCGEVVSYRDIQWQEGPGLGWMEPAYTRRRQQRNRSDVADTLTLFTDAAELLGDRWSSLAMRSAFTGLNRFDEMQADSAMASNMLSERLASLVERNFLEAEAYQEAPTRYAYYPTTKACDYLPILLMLQRGGTAISHLKKDHPLFFITPLAGHTNGSRRLQRIWRRTESRCRITAKVALSTNHSGQDIAAKDCLGNSGRRLQDFKDWKGEIGDGDDSQHRTR